MAVCYARSGFDQVDALILNAEAYRLLDTLDGGGQITEVELLHDPATGDVAVRAWRPHRPAATLHRVAGCRWGVPDGCGDETEWTRDMRALWPCKIEAPLFLGTWDIPAATLRRPAFARVQAGMLVFNPLTPVGS